MARPRIVIVGAGFAGFTAARHLAGLSRGGAEIVLINPTDYFLYLPLLPEVAAGILEPRRVTVSLTETLPGVRLVLGHVDGFDLDGRTVTYRDPEGGRGTLGYHRLVIAVGSVNKLLPVPGVTEYAHGFRGIAEALYLRDHITRQIEMAGTATDPDEQPARCTFVVVGAGYTGTEVAAQGVLYTGELVRRWPEPGGQAALAADRHGRPGAAHPRPRGWPTASDRGAPRARRRGADADQRQGGDPARRAPVHRRVRADPVADLVRRGAARPGGRAHRPAHRTGPVGGRRVPHGAGPPRRLRDRGRGRGARPDPARGDHRDDRAARRPARGHRGAEHRGLLRVRAGAAPTGITTWASSSIWVGSTRRPTRSAYR